MRKISAWLLVAVLVCCGLFVSGRGDAQRKVGTPQAPLYRDPVFDGAADPSLIWNDKERSWWVFYTNRRANAPDAQDGDGIPEHRTEYGSRGLGGYDEGPFSDKTLYGADLIAAEARAFDSYAAILELRGEAREAAGFREKAMGLREKYAERWWNESLGLYADFIFVDGQLGFEDQF